MSIPRESRVTISSVAREVGVAVSTVSLVLNNKAESVGIAPETVLQVRRAAQSMGYKPNHFARSLRLQRSGLLGLVLSGISQETPGQLFTSIREVLEYSNPDMMPLLTSHDYDSVRERRELQFLAKNRVEAIVSTPIGPYATNYEPIVKEGIPVIFVIHGIQDAPEDASGIYLDSAAMSLAAMHHLAEGGARRIAYIAWDYGTLMSRDKLRGVQEHQRTGNTGAALTGMFVQPPGTSFETSLDILFSDPEKAPDALLCNPHEAAIACLNYLDRRGIAVPGQCAVMSLEDHNVFRSHRVSITAMAPDILAIGRRAAEVALTQIAAKKQHTVKEVLAAYRVVERSSTRPSKADAGVRG